MFLKEMLPNQEWTPPMESRAEEVLIELAASLEDADVRGLEPGTWLVALDEDLAIVIELDADRGVLVLSTDLGHPSPIHQSTVHTLLLQASAAWRDLGGVHMALDPEDQAVLQFAELPLAGLEPGAAAARLLHFADMARHGRGVIAGFAASALEPVLPTLHDFLRA